MYSIPGSRSGVGSIAGQPKTGQFISPGQLSAPHLKGRNTPAISFEPFDNIHEQWRTLTLGSPRATLYHSDRWIDALRLTYGFEFQAALRAHNGEVQAGVLFARVRRPFARWWVALPFSDSCPPLALEGTAEAELFGALREVLGQQRFEMRGVIAPPPWQKIDNFLSWELDLSRSGSALYRGLNTNFRRNVTKALKSGITIEHGNSPEMVGRFYRLQQHSRRRLGLPCQPLRFFQILRQRFGDDIEIWLASHQGNDTGAVLLLGDGDTLYYKWSARHSNENSGAGHLLTWSLVEQWAGKFQRLDLGRSDVRNEGLNRFKRSLGARSAVLPYAFFPTAPHNPPSSEVLSPQQRILTGVWKLLPDPVCRGIERFAYRYFC